MCVVLADQSLQNWDSQHLALPESKACCFLSVSSSVMPTGCQTALQLRTHIDTKGFNAASLNCEAISQLTSLLLHLQLGENALQVNRTALRAAWFRASYKASCTLPPAPKDRFDRKATPETLYFLGPLFHVVYISPLLLL